MQHSSAGINPFNLLQHFHFRLDACCWPQSWACQRQLLCSGLKKIISCAFLQGLCNLFVTLVGCVDETITKPCVLLCQVCT